MSINALHKGDDYDDDDNTIPLIIGATETFLKSLRQIPEQHSRKARN